MAQTYSTIGLAKPDVEPYWQDVVCRTYVPIGCHVENGSDFRGTVHYKPMGQVELTQISAQAARYDRTPTEIRRDDIDDYLVCLVTTGSKQLAQSGRATPIRPGELCMFDTARPYVVGAPEQYDAILLKIPRLELNSRLPAAERLSAMRVASDGPYARLAAAMLRSTADILLDDAEQAHRLVPSLIDLVALAFDESFVGLDQGQPRYTRIVERAEAVIRERLFDEDFDASMIPAEIGVSPRTLCRALAQQGITPAKWIWQKRLDAARDMLVARRGMSVSEVAITCGFSDFSHFSRAFKRRFTVSPSAFVSK
ncbi:helix-turn-helix domain-containing protein [Labrys wisconsinensis]|uniref:AraC-like DNA-binding protein n=1 Tax=Labrys wisconsinensis TaxID=425677 RepID=A0ABU0JBZ8_9HYPH|nr:helix-turn-helix domain-containing protein [Labrys wisconsinensis]MDQ0471798.1 AraC-like DNA-binding protein [Labrys wisconsinensis]